MINPESSLQGSSKPKIPKECAMLRPRCDLEPGKCQGSIDMSRCVKLQLQKLNIKLSSAGRPIIDPVTAKGIDVHLILVPLGDGLVCVSHFLGQGRARMPGSPPKMGWDGYWEVTKSPHGAGNGQKDPSHFRIEISKISTLIVRTSAAYIPAPWSSSDGNSGDLEVELRLHTKL